MEGFNSELIIGSTRNEYWELRQEGAMRGNQTVYYNEFVSKLQCLKWIKTHIWFQMYDAMMRETGSVFLGKGKTHLKLSKIAKDIDGDSLMENKNDNQGLDSLNSLFG